MTPTDRLGLARRALLAATAILGAPTFGCSTPLPGDCATPEPPTSPINIYIDGAPSNIPLTAFTVTATGSKGDTPSLQGVGGNDFQGTGQTDESYQVTVKYQGATLYQGTVTWSVAGCGFVVNAYFVQDGGFDSGD
jgi:hypothetical protein